MVIFCQKASPKKPEPIHDKSETSPQFKHKNESAPKKQVYLLLIGGGLEVEKQERYYFCKHHTRHLLLALLS